MTLLSHADYERIAANLSYPTEAFIGGAFAPALSGETMPTVNPATGKEIARVASCGREDVDKAVAAARKAFESGAWSRMHPSERKKILMRFIGLIEKHQVELAVLESLDSGKPVRECLLTDLPETIECLEWHAECADKQYGGISPSGDGRLGLIVREPAGVVACVLPWNFPLMMVGLEARPRPCRRQQRHPQARQRHLALHPEARGVRRRSGHPRRRVQRDHGPRLLRGRSARAAPRRGRGVLHRLHRSGPPLP